MKVGELFAGIHGFGLGFERAGFNVAWAVEIDANAQKVSRRHYPDLLRVNDVKDAGGWLPPVDVIVFGSPCQDLSVAGQRKGMAGARSGLFFDAMRVIRECRPRFAVWENVPGAFSSSGGEDFRSVLHEFLDSGARDVAWRVLDSQYFGVAQRRRRVFVVADFGGECAGEILFEREGMRGYPPSRREAGEGTPGAFALGSHAGSGGDATNRSHAKGGPVGFGLTEEFTPSIRAGRTQTVAGTLGGGTGQRGWTPDTDRMTFISARASRNSDTCNEFGIKATDVHDSLSSDGPGAVISPAISSKWAKGSGGPSGDECQNLVTTVQNTGAGWWNESDTGATIRTPDGGGSREANLVVLGGDVTHALTANGADASEDGTGRGTPIVATVAPPIGASGAGFSRTGNERTEAEALVVSFGWNKSASQSMRVDDTTDALQASESSNPAVIRSGVRRLTPTECEKLQGFPDGWTDNLSDSARYRVLGNAVCVNVAAWIARRIKAALEAAHTTT